MIQEYNLDQPIDRSATDATKYAELKTKYGRGDLFPMWIADMDFRSPQPVRDALRLCLEQDVLGYTTAPDSFWQSIISWLDRRHGWRMTREMIDFVPGVKKALGLCINYFTEPGDKIVIQPPVYHSFRSVIEGNRRVTIDNPLIYSDGTYSMDFDSLRRIASEHKPKMMILCNPHNPIGIQWDCDSLKQVVEICHEHGIIILSDEIYGDLVYPSAKHIPTATVSPAAAEITVTLGAPSKSFNIPGLATAWVAVMSPSLRHGFFEWLRASEFDTPPIDTIYATRAAYNHCQEWLDGVLAYLDENARYARDFILSRLPEVRIVAPNAGFGLWIDLNPLGLSSDLLSDILVNKARLALSEGESFGHEGIGFVRLNTGMSREALTYGLTRMTEALAPYSRL